MSTPAHDQCQESVRYRLRQPPAAALAQRGARVSAAVARRIGPSAVRRVAGRPVPAAPHPSLAPSRGGDGPGHAAAGPADAYFERYGTMYLGDVAVLKDREFFLAALTDESPAGPSSFARP